jgi:anti-sigma factor RsiW
LTNVKACERYLNAIQELVDGTLGPIRRAELELHLESCDACRALAEDLQAIAAAARRSTRSRRPTGLAADLRPPARRGRQQSPSIGDAATAWRYWRSPPRSSLIVGARCIS